MGFCLIIKFIEGINFIYMDDVMKKNAIILIILRPLVWFVSKFVFFAKFNGIENIPANSCAILAGNHTSIKDCLLIIAICKRTPYFIVKKELHSSKIGKWFFSNSGTIPVDRNKKNPKAMDEAKSLLANGNLLVLFPEGTINKTKETIMPFKYGAVKLSNDTGAPIVPFVIKGKYKYFRKSISITFLKPISKNDDLDKYNEEFMNIVKNELERK